MESDVEEVSAKIVEAVELIMNPITTTENRRQAHELLDNFKDTSPLCAKCGFFLASKSNPPIIRHCGFQLIDNYIKLHWNEINVEEKLWIKNSIVQTIATGTESVIKEEIYVKDAVSRIVVELIKREWPQQWPSLMEELHTLCCMGDEQTELVLLVFSRLADDIVQFQNVPDVRRREIYKTLCSHLNDLFAFFWKTLSSQAEIYIANKNLGISNERTLKTCRVVQVTLETLSTFVEWVPITFIVKHPLLKLLSRLLEIEDLRMPAVMCLLNILERKGKPEERKELLIFFEEPALFNTISALDLCDERHYLFLKVLFQCFLSLGTNLCSSMAQFSVAEPENFPLYLNCALLFAGHPSVVLSHTAQFLWLNILRSPHLSFSPSVMGLFPTLLNHVLEKLLKSGYPSKTDSLSCKFSLFEFDSDEEFEVAFCRLRADVADVLRLITKIRPQIAFNYCRTLLKSLLKGQDWISSLDLEKNVCWEAMVIYIDAVCNPLMKIISNPDHAELIQEGMELLDLCIKFSSEDAVILSYSLSCISSLFFFIKFSPGISSEVIKKIFITLTCFTKDGPFVKDVMNLRRHASSLLIKLSCNHPTLLLPEFDNLCRLVQELFQTNEYLTQFDKCALLEALMILSNKFCDFERQSDFLKAVLSPIIQIWFSPVIISGIESPEAFVTFIGVDKPYLESTFDGPISKDASDLMFALNVVKACVKRCVCPNDPETAKKGNYIHPLSDSIGSLFYRNPAAQYIIPILEKIIQLLRTLNALHDPLQQQKFDPSFRNILGILDSDKNSILGNSYIDNSQQQKTSGDRMKFYLHGLYDGCLHTLGNSVENFSIDFYTIRDVTTLLKESLLHKIEYMPAFNLRSLIRLFLRPFFLWCPSTAYNELMGVLADLCPFMLQKLSTIWEKFKSRYGTSIGYEDQQTEVEEILEDQLNRLVTREYISFLGELLHKQKTCSLNEDSMEDDHKEPTSNQAKTLTELGLKVIQTESVRPIFICTAFESLRWLDTTTNIKALQLCELLFNKIIEDGLVQQIQEANYLLQSVLHGLQELGEHEANLGLMLSFGIAVYENLRERFPDIRPTLMSAVACNEQCIKRLDDVLTKNSQKTKNDKQKKDAFKNVISRIIGKNIGQHHKKEVVIKNLSPLIHFKPKENSSLLDIELNDDIGICSLFAPNGEK